MAVLFENQVIPINTLSGPNADISVLNKVVHVIIIGLWKVRHFQEQKLLHKIIKILRYLYLRAPHKSTRKRGVTAPHILNFEVDGVAL